MKIAEVIIIAGHGSTEKDADSTESIAKGVHKMLHPSCRNNCVRPAYLQFMQPGLLEAINQAVHDGANKIIIHPLLLSRGFHVTKNIPEIIHEAQSQFPDTEFVYTQPIGSHDKLAEIVIERIKQVTDFH